ncbi:hypothetical protein ACNUDN_18830 [Mycobacterium sp. smrl_JER01]|uniref:hypothetical protein n=1 Tax=Mycobacterium sp. smrl_JER01 TaxID=3402633 RepID=UPI003AD3E41E
MSGRHRRWRWAALTLAVIVIAAGGLAWWAIDGDGSASSADCDVAADTVIRWQAAVADLAPVQGATGPSDEVVDEQYLQMATMVQAAADSVTTPDIKQRLTDWAAAADRLATSHRDVPGGAEPAQTPEQMDEVFTPINDAVGALDELCPDMPSAQQ